MELSKRENNISLTKENFGVIPRAIQLIFDLISKEQDRWGGSNKFTVYCSLLIYLWLKL